MEFIDVFPFILTRIMPGLLSPGSAKADVRWGENWNTYLITSCVRNISAKYYLNLIIFIQGTIDNVGDVFSGFLFFLMHISLDLLSLGSAESYTG